MRMNYLGDEGVNYCAVKTLTVMELVSHSTPVLKQHPLSLFFCFCSLWGDSALLLCKSHLVKELRRVCSTINAAGWECSQHILLSDSNGRGKE